MRLGVAYHFCDSIIKSHHFFLLAINMGVGEGEVIALLDLTTTTKVVLLGFNRSCGGDYL